MVRAGSFVAALTVCLVGVCGTIVDGTYTLTEQIYYNQPGCPTLAMGGTIGIAGNCIQTANNLFSITASAS